MICRFKIGILRPIYCGMFLYCLMLNLAGCGVYSFSSSGASHLKTVAIPIFQDQTAEFGVKEELTDAVIDQFTKDNTLRVTDRRRADVLLEGTLLSVRDEAGAFTSNESVKDIKIFITISVQYQDLTKRKLLWEDEITQWGTFNPDDNSQSRKTAISEAIEKIATDILNKSVSGW